MSSLVEFHSLSKTFNMTGWRVGFAAGNPVALSALAKVKNNVDSGVFGAIQEAAFSALRAHDAPWVRELRATYAALRWALRAPLERAGWDLVPSNATFYVWARCPDGYDSMRCAAKMLDEAGVLAIPGIGFGKPGDAYVRFALTVGRERIAEAIERLGELTW